jgi:hypothetical protein
MTAKCKLYDVFLQIDALVPAAGVTFREGDRIKEGPKQVRKSTVTIELNGNQPAMN